MPRPVWKGHISFGLVNVPVTLYSAEQNNSLSFHLLDRRDTARVRYQRVNEATGEEVAWDDIVKGYEYEKGHYVMLSDEELDEAAPAMTKRIEIEQFVDLHEIGVMFFERPYYLVPEKGAEKGYALLRDAMATAKRVGIARVVIRSKGYLAALMPQGDALILELLRYAEELQPSAEFDLPHADDRKLKTSKKELDLALQLVEGMTSKWNPKAYHDDYRAALLNMIEKRAKSGKAAASPKPADDHDDETPRTVNFMDMLRKSVKAAGTRTKPKPRAKAGGRRRRRRRAG